MNERNLVGVQIQAVGRMPVEHVALDGGVQSVGMCGVYAQLVGTACMREECDARCAVGIPFQHLIIGYGRFAVLVAYHLLRPVVGIQTERQGDGAFILCYVAFQQGDVAFSDGAEVKLPLQSLVYIFCLGYQQQPGGVHVEPVDRQRTVGIGKAESGNVGYGNTVAFSRNGEHSFRLVDYPQPVVFVNGSYSLFRNFVERIRFHVEALQHEPQ